MQHGPGALGRAHLPAGGDPLEGQGRLLPEARGDGQLARVMLQPTGQVGFLPTHARYFLRDDPMGLLFGGSPVELPGVVLSIGMHLPAGLLASLSQRLEQLLTIHIIEGNVLSPAPPIHGVIDRAGILHSHRARHRTSSRTAPTVKRDRGCGRLRFVPAGTTYGCPPLLLALRCQG